MLARSYKLRIAGASSANGMGSELCPTLNYFGPDPYVGYVKYGRRLRTVSMQGCWSANVNGHTNGGSPSVITQWPSATGTPPGVDQNANRLYKSAFLGFEHVIAPEPAVTEILWSDWPHPEEQIPSAPISVSFRYALDFAFEGDSAYISLSLWY